MERRNTCTAILFLVGIFSALVFLVLGVLPSGSAFAPAKRPAHSTAKTKTMFLWAPTKSGKTTGALLKHNKWEDIVAKAMVKEDQKQPKAAYRAWRNKVKKRPSGERKVTDGIVKSLGQPLPGYDQLMEPVTGYIDAVEPGLHSLLDREHTFIEVYGAAQQVLGRRMLEDADPQYTVVKLSNGLLSFVDPGQTPRSMVTRASEMVDFARVLRDEYHTPLLYVQAPSKLDIAQLPDGAVDYADAEADQFILLLQKGGVDALDLRSTYRDIAREDPQKAASLFFRTDHHWTPAGAFIGYQQLCDKLSRRYRFTIDSQTLKAKNYDKYTFHGTFLGSQGRRVGSLYAGVDDIEIWSPKFPNDFLYSVPISGINREGPFDCSLLFPERLSQEGFYTTNPYTIYSGGDYLLARAFNLKKPTGKRIMVLRDSFGCAITPFLALTCSEVITIDPRNFNGNQEAMLNYVDWLKPDLVMVLNTTGSLEVDNLFPYLPTSRADARAAKLAEKAEK